MATKGTAAAWRADLPVPFAVAGILLTLALGGCESGSSILGGANQPAVAVTNTAPAVKMVSVAVTPVLGVPEATSKQLVDQLAGGLDKSRFNVVTGPQTPADYTLRGYATAAKDKAAGAKLSYFFDVIDQKGTKVNRIAGEEVLPGAPVGKDVWLGLTPQISKAVATKTAQSFAAYVPPSGPALAAAAVSAAPATPVAPSGVTKAAVGPADVAAATPAKPGGPATGSIDKAPVTAVVPSVTGAPGDGSQSLAAALQKELSKNGVAMTDGTTTTAYKVEGKVAVGPDKEGKQPIQIDWVVKDPQGKKLGTVSQKNDIPQGSLDGAWGKTADAAAAAAAQGILKLIPGAKVTQ